MSERQKQRTQQLQEILQTNKEANKIMLSRDFLKGLLQDEQQLRQVWKNKEKQLQGKMAVVSEELEGRQREQLREQLRQRVDKALSRQPAREQLRHQVLELRASVLRDFRVLEPEEKLLKAEFQGVLEEQMMHHGRSEQELIDILGDLTGKRPQY